jgi:hypothetical protein
VTRWRCNWPSCPCYRWQVVMVLGECDPVEVAMGELESHYSRVHRDQEDRRVA